MADFSQADAPYWKAMRAAIGTVPTSIAPCAVCQTPQPGPVCLACENRALHEALATERASVERLERVLRILDLGAVKKLVEALPPGVWVSEKGEAPPKNRRFVTSVVTLKAHRDKDRLLCFGVGMTDKEAKAVTDFIAQAHMTFTTLAKESPR